MRSLTLRRRLALMLTLLAASAAAWLMLALAFAPLGPTVPIARAMSPRARPIRRILKLA